MKTLLGTALCAATLTVTTLYAQDAKDAKASVKDYSYAVGYTIGSSLKREGVPFDTAQIAQAINDVLNDKTPKFSDEQMQASLESLMAMKQEQKQKQVAANRKIGEAYLAKHAKEKGVKTTASGLQYKVITAGKGAKPKPTDTVTVHYRGTLIDGKEFDSSYKRGEPATFPVSGVIKGWQEVLPMMSVGSKWEVAIPSELAYGERGAGADIEPNSTLLFEIELLKIAN